MSHIGRVLKSYSNITQPKTQCTQELALAIALPDEYPSIRLPTVDYPRSSIATLSDQYSWTVPPVSPTSLGFLSGSFIAALYGQPARSMMVWQSLSTGAYDCSFDGPNSSRWCIAPGDPFLRSNGDYWPLVTAAFRSGTSPPHGRTMALGVSRGHNFVFLNNSDRINIEASGGPFGTLTGALNFSVWKWCGKEQSPTQATWASITVTAGTIVPTSIYTLSGNSGYFAVQFDSVQITSGDAGTGNHELRVDVQCSANEGFALLHSPDVDPLSEGDVNMLTETRLNSSSLLMTNTTSVLNKQGTVIAARLRKVDVTQATFDMLTKAAEKYTGAAEKGVYTFKEFTEEASQFKSAYIRNLQGTVTGLAFDLDVDDYYHLIYISANTANQFNVRHTGTYEYKTEVARYAKDVSPYAYTDLILARRLISSNPEWFYENPLHMADVYRFVRRAVKFAGKYAGTAASVIQALAPQYGAPAGLAAAALQGFAEQM